jgi:septal ring factor EnvC (AmiA/AmiB activator)
MEDELRLLRQAHEEQARRVVAERVVAAECVRVLEQRAEQLKRQVADAERRAAEARRETAAEHEKARRHVEAARRERDAAVRELEDFRGTPTYRLVTLVHQVLSRGSRRSR